VCYLSGVVTSFVQSEILMTCARRETRDARRTMMRRWSRLIAVTPFALFLFPVPLETRRDQSPRFLAAGIPMNIERNDRAFIVLFHVVRMLTWFLPSPLSSPPPPLSLSLSFSFFLFWSLNLFIDRNYTESTYVVGHSVVQRDKEIE